MAIQVLYPDAAITNDSFLAPAGQAWNTFTLATGYALFNDQSVPENDAALQFQFPAHTGGGTPSSIKLKFNVSKWSYSDAPPDSTYFSVWCATNGGGGAYTFPPLINQEPVQPFPDPTILANVYSGQAFEFELLGYTNVPTNVAIGFLMQFQFTYGGFCEITDCRLEVTIPDPPLGLVRLHKPLYTGDHLIHNVDIDDEFNQITGKLSGGVTGKQVQFTKNASDPCLETVNSGGGPLIDMQQNSVSKFRVIDPPQNGTDSITIDYLENTLRIPHSILLFNEGKEIIQNGSFYFASPVFNSDYILTEVRATINDRSTVVPPTCTSPDFNIIFTLRVQKAGEDIITDILTKTVSATDFGDMSVPLVLWTGQLYSFKTGDRLVLYYQQAHKPPIPTCLGQDMLADIWVKDLSVNLMGHHFFKGSQDVGDPDPTTT